MDGHQKLSLDLRLWFVSYLFSVLLFDGASSYHLEYGCLFGGLPAGSLGSTMVDRQFAGGGERTSGVDEKRFILVMLPIQ
ncbi:hypothetical protein J3F83DRAFT_435833 [Trichoderma novae-zelandiae]